MDIRLIVFSVVLLGCIALEVWLPRRKRDLPRLIRWPSNLLVSALNVAVLRLIVPITAVGAALWAQSQGYGLFNLINTPFNVIFAVILLDLAIYGQHVLFHKVPLLWRFHRMHHADTEIDVTTGLRFHPIEAILSMIIKIGVVIALGAPALAVLIFEILLNAGSMFSHSNLKLPLGFDRVLRLIFVTPDMHRVHHSVYRSETDSNYGFNLAIWDRIFKTYQDQPRDGHEEMQIGLSDFRDEPRLDKMLTQPFRTPQQ